MRRVAHRLPSLGTIQDTKLVALRRIAADSPEGRMVMSKYISRGRSARFATALLALVAMGACVEKKSDTLAQDSTLNKDIQLANADSTAQPQLRDTAAVAAAPAPAPVAPAPAASRTTTTRTTTRTPVRTTPTPTPRPTTPAPTTSTTASGNTVTRSSGGGTSGGAVGTIASGSSL